MNQGAWLRDEQRDLAVARILSAVGRAVSRAGVEGVTMEDVAREAGCSRGTLYRYFETRDELHLAFVLDGARRVSEQIAAETARDEEPRARLADAIRSAIAEVRARPALAAWFDPTQAGRTARLARRPELIDALAAGFADVLGAAGRAGHARALGLRFAVRMIVSLLANPEPDEADERALIEHCVVPGILAAGRGGPRSGHDR